MFALQGHAGEAGGDGIGEFPLEAVHRLDRGQGGHAVEVGRPVVPGDQEGVAEGDHVVVIAPEISILQQFQRPVLSVDDEEALVGQDEIRPILGKGQGGHEGRLVDGGVQDVAVGAAGQVHVEMVLRRIGHALGIRRKGDPAEVEPLAIVEGVEPQQFAAVRVPAADDPQQGQARYRPPVGGQGPLFREHPGHEAGGVPGNAQEADPPTGVVQDDHGSVTPGSGDNDPAPIRRGQDLGARVVVGMEGEHLLQGPARQPGEQVVLRRVVRHLVAHGVEQLLRPVLRDQIESLHVLHQYLRCILPEEGVGDMIGLIGLAGVGEGYGSIRTVPNRYDPPQITVG